MGLVGIPRKVGKVRLSRLFPRLERGLEGDVMSSLAFRSWSGVASLDWGGTPGKWDDDDGDDNDDDVEDRRRMEEERRAWWVETAR